MLDIERDTQAKPTEKPVVEYAKPVGDDAKLLKETTNKSLRRAGALPVRRKGGGHVVLNVARRHQSSLRRGLMGFSSRRLKA